MCEPGAQEHFELLEPTYGIKDVSEKIRVRQEIVDKAMHPKLAKLEALLVSELPRRWLFPRAWARAARRTSRSWWCCGPMRTAHGCIS